MGIEHSWLKTEKWLLVAVLGLEMFLGVVGNGLVLFVKVKVRFVRWFCHSLLRVSEEKHLLVLLLFSVQGSDLLPLLAAFPESHLVRFRYDYLL